MKDIFDRHNYITEADDDGDTDFTLSSFDTNASDDKEDSESEEQTNNDSSKDTDFTSMSNDNDSDDDNNTDDNTGEDDNSAGEENSEDGNDDNTEENQTEEDDLSDEDEENEPVDIVAKEKELYTSLSSFDIHTRNEEIKYSFSKLYNFINEYLDILTDIKKSNVNLKVLEYCEEKLVELKSLTYYYITHNFSQDSYIQKQIRYKKILFTISKIIDLLDKISNKKETNEDV